MTDATASQPREIRHIPPQAKLETALKTFETLPSENKIYVLGIFESVLDIKSAADCLVELDDNFRIQLNKIAKSLRGLGFQSSDDINIGFEFYQIIEKASKSPEESFNNSARIKPDAFADKAMATILDALQEGELPDLPDLEAMVKIYRELCGENRYYVERPPQTAANGPSTPKVTG